MMMEISCQSRCGKTDEGVHNGSSEGQSEEQRTSEEDESEPGDSSRDGKANKGKVCPCTGAAQPCNLGSNDKSSCRGLGADKVSQGGSSRSLTKEKQWSWSFG